jgi:hypothetical protein
VTSSAKAAHRTSQRNASGHRAHRPATTSPEVVMTAHTLAVIWRAVAKAYPNKRHGLPGCRTSQGPVRAQSGPSQGSTHFRPLYRAGLNPGAVLFELLWAARCGFLAILDLIRPPPYCCQIVPSLRMRSDPFGGAGLARGGWARGCQPSMHNPRHIPRTARGRITAILVVHCAS